MATFRRSTGCAPVGTHARVSDVWGAEVPGANALGTEMLELLCTGP